MGKKKESYKSKNTWIVFSIVAVLALVIGGYIWYSNITSSVATIENEKITGAEYRYFLSTVKYQMEADADLEDEASRKAFWDSKVQGTDAKEVAKQRALDSVKEYKVQLMKANENGIFLNDNDLKRVEESTNQFLNSIAQASQMLAGSIDNVKGTEEAIKEMYGISISECKTIFKNLRLIYKFIEEEQKKMTVTDEEMKTRYDEDKDIFDTVKVRQILLSTWNSESKEPMTDEEKKEVYKRAEEILEKIDQGEDMEDMAVELSDDAGAEKNKGLIEVDYSKTLIDELEPFTSWAVKNKIGDTGIVETDYGYHISRIEERTNYAEATIKVKNVILSERYEDILSEWVKEPKYDIIKNDFALKRVKI